MRMMRSWGMPPRAEANVASDEPKQEEDLRRGQEEAILVLEDDPDERAALQDDGMDIPDFLKRETAERV